jgi:curved DNA-binding protein CbpA
VATHYEMLGVAPDATDDEVRQAYLRRARELHPDRLVGGSTREMQDVNEAWRVLGDRGRRRDYDRELAPTPTAVRVPPEIDPDDVPYPQALADPDDVAVRVVRALPWVVVTAVLAVIFVFTAFAGSGDDQPSGYDLAGKCISTGGGTREVRCEPGIPEVVLVVSRQSQCPSGASAVPYADDWLCLRPFE